MSCDFKLGTLNLLGCCLLGTGIVCQLVVVVVYDYSCVYCVTELVTCVPWVMSVCMHDVCDHSGTWLSDGVQILHKAMVILHIYVILLLLSYGMYIDSILFLRCSRLLSCLKLGRVLSVWKFVAPKYDFD